MHQIFCTTVLQLNFDCLWGPFVSFSEDGCTERQKPTAL